MSHRLLACLLLVLGGCADDAPVDEHEHHHAEEAPAGPHGGRLLADGDLTVEVALDERGGGALLRAWATAAGQPVDVTIDVTLRRFGDRIERHRLEPHEGAFASAESVEEPHSFDVEVVAVHDGRTHRWTYESHEGRTEIPPHAAAAAGITIETVGPATVRSLVAATGRIVPNEERLAHVVPRYPGVLTAVRKRLGDAVAEDEVLAVVESNESLRPYEVRAPIAGTVIARDAVPGELARDGRPIYTIAGLDPVWVELHVRPAEAGGLAVGQRVAVRAGDARADAALVHVAGVADPDTQTVVARAALPNPDGRWRPGLFVAGEIAVGEATVPAAVKPSALQRLGDEDVVFATDGTTFQAVPVELGRRDADWVEVVSGLAPGDRYAAENSFVVKADVAKAGAHHDH